MHHGESRGANVNIRGAQDSGNSEPVTMNKGEVMNRVLAPQVSFDMGEEARGESRNVCL